MARHTLGDDNAVHFHGAQLPPGGKIVDNFYRVEDISTRGIAKWAIICSALLFVGWLFFGS